MILPSGQAQKDTDAPEDQRDAGQHSAFNFFADSCLTGLTVRGERMATDGIDGLRSLSDAYLVLPKPGLPGSRKFAENSCAVRLPGGALEGLYVRDVDVAFLQLYPSLFLYWRYSRWAWRLSR